MQRLEETKLRKADCSVVVDCFMFFNISSGIKAPKSSCAPTAARKFGLRDSESFFTTEKS